MEIFSLGIYCCFWLDSLSSLVLTYFMISGCPRQVAASVDEHVVVKERHVAGRGWTTCKLPFGVVGRRRVQSGVQHYDATVADLWETERIKKEGIDASMFPNKNSSTV